MQNAFEAITSLNTSMQRQAETDGTTTRTRLKGLPLLVARALSLGTILLLLGLFAARIPAQLAYSTSGFIGVRVSTGPGGETRLAPTPGLPAAEAGIQTGDILLAVDGEPVRAGLTKIEAHWLLIGPAGEPVNLEVRKADGSRQQFAILRGGQLHEETGLPAEAYGRYFLMLDLIVLFGFCVPALIIFLRRSDDWMGMYVALVLVVLAVSKPGEITVLAVLDPAWRWTNILFSMLYNLSILVLFFIFPTGQIIPRWGRYVIMGGIAWAVLKQLPPPYNPLTWPLHIGNLLDLSLFGTGVLAQIHRYRRHATPKERLQTKWVVFGLIVAFVGVYAYYLPQYFIPALQDPSVETLRYRIIGRPLAYLALLTVPVTFLFSILRYRLYDIDLLINRTLVYVPLTAILAGQYSASVTLSQRLFVAATGQKSDAAIVFTTLIAAATFTPLKNYLQSVVDRHFKEAPDPAKELKAFNEQVQNRVFAVDHHKITQRLLEEAVQAFDAKSGAIYWGSGEDPAPVHATRGWNGDIQLCVPLKSRDGNLILGAICLGARRNEAEYNPRELEVLNQTAQVVAQAIEEDRRGS